MTEDEKKAKSLEGSDIYTQIEIAHKWGISPDERTIFLDSSEYMTEDGTDLGIAHHSAMRFIKNLSVLQSISEEPIVIIMNSIGGDVRDGFAIYDAIQHCSCSVIMKVYGNCMSMGCIILQAADYRILSPNCSIMFHHGDPGCAGGCNTFEMVNFATHSRDIGQRADDIVMNVINRKRKAQGQSLLTSTRFQELNLRGKYMFAEEAVRIGIADYIIPSNKTADIQATVVGVNTDE